MKKVIHYNPALSHQCDHAKAFEACGFEATTDPRAEADIHVISGPHYAKAHWLNHPRVLEIDRAWWGDPDSISIGWLQPDGTRKFANGDVSRETPIMEPWKTREDSCLILADYGQDPSEIEHAARMQFTSVRTRLHPADSRERYITTLETMLRLHDVAIGHAGTSIFEAIKMGVPVICTDPKNECMPVCSGLIDAPLYRGDRKQWLHEMSYKQFSLAEISSGLAWELLKCMD